MTDKELYWCDLLDIDANPDGKGAIMEEPEPDKLIDTFPKLKKEYKEQGEYFPCIHVLTRDNMKTHFKGGFLDEKALDIKQVFDNEDVKKFTDFFRVYLTIITGYECTGYLKNNTIMGCEECKHSRKI